MKIANKQFTIGIIQLPEAVAFKSILYISAHLKIIRHLLNQ